MNCEKPKGVTIAVILLLLDAALMMIFLAVLVVAPDYVSSFKDIGSSIAFIEEYGLLNSEELALEISIFGAILDILIIIGLLSANPSGRKLAISGTLIVIVSHAMFFGITGIVAFSILLWYLLRAKTKEYFII